jgi:hypothetical protein
MKQRWRAGLVAGFLVAVAVMPLSAADKGVTLIGVGYVPATILDKSGLQNQPICMRDDQTVCIDHATLGGFGSALAFTGHDDVFVAVPDRGPFDGRTDTPYLDRFDFLYMKVDPAKAFPNIATVLLDTRFLRNEDGRNFLGDAYASANNDRNYLRLDPEGVRVSRDGNVFISDEYGPFLFEFDRQGHLLRRIPVPERFLIANPTGDVDAGGNSLELYPDHNTTGRQANRGMEGLAVTPDGRKLVGIMQNALLQDHGLNPSNLPSRLGLNNRIFMYDLVTGEHHEYVYKVDAIGSGRGVNEILAINDHEFLVLERDNKSNRPTPPNGADTPVNKKIYKIDLNKPNLTDVSGMDELPAGASASLVAVDKTLIINLVDTDYKVDGGTLLRDAIAEKIEGLAWGPDLPDGRHVLYVISDNDLFTGNDDIPGGRPTQIFAFAIDSSADGANFIFQPQQLPGPLYPPGLVKKQVQ